MLLSTPALVLHTTPYGDTSLIAKVFTRLLGVRSYIIKGSRTSRAKLKVNLLQPLSSLDMVVYDNPHTTLNYVKEMSPRHPQPYSDPIVNALRFFMTEVLYKALQEGEPMPELWDYVEEVNLMPSSMKASELPISFMLHVAHHLGIEPLDNHAAATPYFDLQAGRFVGQRNETSLSPPLSATIHGYLADSPAPIPPLAERTAVLNALIAYYQLHLSTFRDFSSHEVLHVVLR